MKKTLLLMAALVLVGGFTTAQSANSCPSVGILNASGLPPTVQGTTLQLLVNGFSPAVTVYIDGSVATTIYDVLDPGTAAFTAVVTVNMAAGSYGAHTMFTNWNSCVLDFTTVQPDPPPPPPPASPTLSDANGGVACPFDSLSWTGVSGATAYTLYSRQLLPSPAASMSQIWSGTSLSKRVSVARGSSYVYAVSACGLNGCSALSNFKTVRGGTCP
jgi:hypothetical protein